MSLLSVALLIPWPGAATSSAGELPGWPELVNLVISLAIVGLLGRWIDHAKGEQAARLREKVVPFPAPSSSRIVAAHR